MRVTEFEDDRLYMVYRRLKRIDNLIKKRRMTDCYVITVNDTYRRKRSRTYLGLGGFLRDWNSLRWKYSVKKCEFESDYKHLQNKLYLEVELWG